jgi:hypothetical protein
MGKACITHGSEYNCVWGCLRNLEGNIPSENLETDGRILGLILNK